MPRLLLVAAVVWVAPDADAPLPASPPAAFRHRPLNVTAAAQTSDPGAFMLEAIGALVGTALGLGVHYRFNDASDRNLDDSVVIPIFTLSQGTIAAAGSRLLGKRSQRP